MYKTWDQKLVNGIVWKVQIVTSNDESFLAIISFTVCNDVIHIGMHVMLSQVNSCNEYACRKFHVFDFTRYSCII